MKKYKLKKDLPLAKVGDLVYVMKNKSKNSEIYKIYEYLEEYQDNRTGKVLGSIDFKDFGEWLEEIEKKPKSVWEFKKGDDYFCIKNGQVLRYQWTNDAVDNDIKLTGDAFVFLEEAEKELKRREAIQKIKKYCWENGIDNEFKYGYFNHYFYYNTQYNEIQFSVTKNKIESSIGYFKNLDVHKIKEKFFEKYIIIGIFILIVSPLFIIALITDLFVFIYIFILKKIFKLEVYYFSFTYLILFGEII